MASTEEDSSLVRDAYGFNVKKELQHLYLQYEPILQREERERGERWTDFLTSVEGNCYQEPATPGGTGRSLTVLADRLDDLLKRNEADLTSQELHDRQQLQSLVQAGVPTEIRGKLWKMFLGVDRKRRPGAYEQLVAAGLEQARVAAAAKAAADAAAAAGMHRRLANSSSSSSLSHWTSQAGSGGSSTQDSPFAAAAASAAGGTSTSGAGGADAAGAVAGGGLASNPSAASLCSRDSEGGASADGSGADGGGGGGVTPKPSSVSSIDWANQIDKDLHRTFPGHLAMDNRGRQALKRILLAYSQYNPFVGYCQGMNFIAGVLLLFMDEEDVFWCLAAVVEDRLPGYFSVAMVAPQVDQLALGHLVSQHLPTLSSLFASHGLELASVSMQWFLCIFVNSLPLESCLRVWDILFFDASPVVLFRVGMALLDVYQKALLATEDGMECLELLAQVAGVSFDGSRLVDVACIAFSCVLERDVMALRQTYMHKITSRIKDLPIDTRSILELHQAAQQQQQQGEEEQVGEQHGPGVVASSQLPSVLETGDPRVITARQLFGCNQFPLNWDENGYTPPTTLQRDGSGSDADIDISSGCSTDEMAASDLATAAAAATSVFAEPGSDEEEDDSDEEGGLLKGGRPPSSAAAGATAGPSSGTCAAAGGDEGDGLPLPARSLSSTRRAILGKMRGRVGAAEGARRPAPLSTSTSYWASTAAAELSCGGGGGIGNGSPATGVGGGGGNSSNRKLVNQAQALLASAVQDRAAAAAVPLPSGSAGAAAGAGAAAAAAVVPSSSSAADALLRERQQQDALGGGATADVSHLRKLTSTSSSTSAAAASSSATGVSALPASAGVEAGGRCTGGASARAPPRWRRLDNHRDRAPSRAQIAAYEIAINPAIRELAIAQSFIRAERSPSADADGGGGGAPSLRDPCTSLQSPSASAATSPSGAGATAGGEQLPRRLSRGKEGQFFVSTTALSGTMSSLTSPTSRPSSQLTSPRSTTADDLTSPRSAAGDASAAWGSGVGGHGQQQQSAAALEQASAILQGVLEGLRREVATAQDRRRAAEERRGMLSQTSGLLSSKLERLLQELEERKQTVEELNAKVNQTRRELRTLEDDLNARDEQIQMATAERDARQQEIRGKDEQIANLQRKVKRFQRKSSASLPPVK